MHVGKNLSRLPKTWGTWKIGRCLDPGIPSWGTLGCFHNLQLTSSTWKAIEFWDRMEEHAPFQSDGVSFLEGE